MSEWHLDKKVNIGHLLTTITLAVSMVAYITAQDKKIEANSININLIKEQRKEDLRRIEKRLDNIDRKLDKLISTK